MEDDLFMVKFWGVRGSYPVPGFSSMLFGGNTSCVEVRVGGHLIILDAGTGIIALGQELVKREETITITLLFSHTHQDHIQGFPFFEPANRENTVLYMFGPRDFGQSLEESITRAMLTPNFPISLSDLKSLRLIGNLFDESQVIIVDTEKECRLENVHRIGSNIPPDAVQIRMLRSHDHPNGVNIYRITWRGKKLVYATDTESRLSDGSRLVAFAWSADLLIHDAQYTDDEYGTTTRAKEGWGHSTHSMALAVGRQAKVKRLAFFHHDPLHSDEDLLNIEKACQEEFPGAFMAQENLAVVL